MTRKRLLNAACLAALVLLQPAIVAGAHAQAAGSPGWFVPNQPAAPRAPSVTPSRQRQVRQVPLPPPQAAPMAEQDPGQDPDAPQQPMPNLPQPAVPALPPVEKGKAPPTPVIGVLGVPDVMRQSNAAQIVQRIIGARKEKLRVDVEKAQAGWREMEQSLQADAAKLTPEQGRNRERTLRERVNTDRRQLQERNRIIQEAGQVALGQIERTLVQIIRQVADSRGMNLVLHRSQVALNVQEFDISDAVVAQLNKVLPTVQIPADNVDPATLPKDWGSPAPGATTVSAPASPPAH